ncbi:hypothetical protein LTR37_019936 [Vermiconidia calcicola]|uniref:Uncharacterized protein n=1 Tax=Vermiconidia calcicola TaxID=1690605 RepID=A0ACC3MDX5_9PEZI|nr:hypothetical protein LTR37_019936 [Vermiconidia calcicola]
MDAITRQMMADLGIERRDIVSAPSTDARGRVVREDTQQQDAIREQVDDRRRRHNDAADGEDTRTARLRAWNTETTFEQDEVTSQLQNRFSGQGHRAGLGMKLRGTYDESIEQMDARVGEERRLHLQSRGEGFNRNYVPTPAPNGRNRFRDEILNGAATPRSSPGRHTFPDHGRHRPSNRAPNHARAPSPRASGTRRFEPTRQRAEARASTAANPGIQAAAAMRAAAGNTAATQAATPIAPSKNTGPTAPASTRAANNVRTGIAALSPAAAPAIKAAAALRATANRTGTPAASPRVPEASSGPSSRASSTVPAGTSLPPLAAAPTSVAAPRQTAIPKSSAASTPSVGDKKSTTTTSQDRARAEIYRTKALWYAATPGEECDLYHEKFPDRKQYLGPARQKLIKEVIALAKSGDQRDIQGYLKLHYERKWMFEAALKAKQQVESDSEEAIEAYYSTHSDQADFFSAAVDVFDRKMTEDTRPASADSTLETSGSDASMETSPKTSPETSMEIGMETTASTPVLSTLGTLAATFYDIAGKFLDIQHFPVNVPAQVTLNVTSRERQFDPRTLIDAIEALAESMQDNSQGLAAAPVAGAKLADDGLWEEDEEL